MRLIYKVGIIAALLALSVLAFPISTGAHEEALIFDTRIKPEPRIVHGPFMPLGPYVSELKPKPPKKTAKKVASQEKTRKTNFKPGYCTDYVARRVSVTWRGDAHRWDDNARAQGYLVDKNPVAGSILVTNESGWGHVAYIESVVGTKVTITEWNYAGRYKLTTRTLDITDPVIVGVIHI